MERIKELFALAPFVALAIAISYLQGYWGMFEILAFPYLSFQELLAYSTAPFFGFAFFALAGMLFGIANPKASTGIEQQKSRWVAWLPDVVLIASCLVLFYLDRPEKWIFSYLFTLILIAPPIIRTDVVQSIRQTNPQLAFATFVMVFLLLGSFGYGRTQAERLIRKNEPNVQLTFDTGSEAGRLIGKLGTYYFFLNASNRVAILPEGTIKRIEYRKEHKGGSL